MLRLALAWLHLIALGIGLGGVIARGMSLRDASDAAALRRAFAFDAVWGIAAVLWLGTGLWRLFGETEKPLGYYMSNHAFFAKMGLFVVIIALEIWPAMKLMAWRTAFRRGAADALVEPAAVRRIVMISYVEAILVTLMVLAAVLMARGYGAMT